MVLVRGSLRKIILRPATRNTLLVLVALIALLYLGFAVAIRAMPPGEGGDPIGTMFGFPTAYGTLATLLLTIGGFAAAAWAGAIAAGEWSWNTFRSAVARGESRPRYVLATLVAAVLVAFIGWLVLLAVGLFGAIAGGMITGGPVGDPVSAVDRMPGLVLAGWWAVSMEAAIGFGVAFVARSQVAGIAALVAIYFAEQFGSVIIPADVLRFAPIIAANSLVGEWARATKPDMLVPLVATTAYLLLAAGAAALVARSSEIA